VRFQNGHKKVGGRKLGGKNLKTLELEALAIGVKGPFRTLLELMNNPDTPQSVIVDCAKALLPFVNRKQPVAFEADVGGEMKIVLRKGSENL